jgi:cell division protein FtsI/penicillin-binding protein 2
MNAMLHPRMRRTAVAAAFFLALSAAAGCFKPERRIVVDTKQLTRVCSAALGGRAGAVVVMDARTGEVVTAVPSAAAASVAHPAGSVFKLVTAVAALDAHSVSPGHVERCAGTDTPRGRRVQCWLHSGHGALSMREAIADSCNIYFSRLGMLLPPSRILAAARALGLGSPTPADRPIPASGRLPDHVTPNDAPAFAAGDTPGITVTPFQIAGLAARIATGRAVVPHPAGNRIPPPVPLQMRSAFTVVREGMAAGVAHGTSSALANLGYTTAGKTGTAPSGKPGVYQAWFVGFSPIDKPEVVVVVFLERGRGATDAVPVARQVLLAWYENRRIR